MLWKTINFLSSAHQVLDWQMTLIWHVPILFGPFFSLRLRLLSEKSGDSFPASDWSPQLAVDPDTGLWLAEDTQMWDSSQSRQNRPLVAIFILSSALFLSLPRQRLTRVNEPEESSHAGTDSERQQRWELQTDLNTLFVTLSSHNFQSQPEITSVPVIIYSSKALVFSSFMSVSRGRFQNLGLLGCRQISVGQLIVKPLTIICLKECLSLKF